MREITTHKVNGLNEDLQIIACDEPGPGGVNHVYQIIDVSKENTAPDAAQTMADLEFQNGGISEVGVNGISQEALLAIVIDRLQGFQSGQFPCRENAIALTKLQEAMHWLHHRTRERVARGGPAHAAAPIGTSAERVGRTIATTIFCADSARASLMETRTKGARTATSIQLPGSNVKSASGPTTSNGGDDETCIRGSRNRGPGTQAASHHPNRGGGRR